MSNEGGDTMRNIDIDWVHEGKSTWLRLWHVDSPCSLFATTDPAEAYSEARRLSELPEDEFAEYVREATS